MTKIGESISTMVSSCWRVEVFVSICFSLSIERNMYKEGVQNSLKENLSISEDAVQIAVAPDKPNIKLVVV